MFSQTNLVFCILLVLSYYEVVTGLGRNSRRGGARVRAERGDFKLILERRNRYEEHIEGSGCDEDEVINALNYVDDEDSYEGSGEVLSDTVWSPPVFEVSEEEYDNEATENSFIAAEIENTEDVNKTQSINLRETKVLEKDIEKDVSDNESEAPDIYFDDKIRVEDKNEDDVPESEGKLNNSRTNKGGIFCSLYFVFFIFVL